MIEIELNNILLRFETKDTIFSPGYIDKGTLAMLSQVEFKEKDKVLDLGCGYGVVGILAGRIIGGSNVFMCDVSEEAVALAHINAELNGVNDVTILLSDGLSNITEENFTIILSNPPYHVDFSVPKNFIEQGYKKLSLGGRMYMVTKREDWYKNKLISVFGGVKIVEIDGYYVFIAEKRIQKFPKQRENENKKENHLSKKLKRKQDGKRLIKKAL